MNVSRTRCRRFSKNIDDTKDHPKIKTLLLKFLDAYENILINEKMYLISVLVLPPGKNPGFDSRQFGNKTKYYISVIQ
jgi:hypothetical protein